MGKWKAVEFTVEEENVLQITNDIVDGRD